MKSVILLAGAIFLAGLHAHATGSFHCELAGRQGKGSVIVVYSYDFGGPLIEITGQMMTPTSNKIFQFKKETTSQYWNNGGEFNLVNFAERTTSKGIETVEFRMKTSGGTDGIFVGKWVLLNNEGVKIITGTANCHGG